MKAARPILLLSLFLVQSAFIVTRDDRSDSDYLDLAGNYPAVCRVGERGGDGTLIAAQWIITAAHVAQGMEQRYGADLRIFFQGISEGYPVDKIAVHPEFVPMGDHDIALIRLKEAVEVFKPAGLYRESDEKGKEIVIVGHGDFKNGAEKMWKSDGKKRAATNRIESVTDNHIIFYFDKPGSDACTNLEGTAGRGDSGGPAFIPGNGVPLVAGISSAGSPGENGREPMVRLSTIQGFQRT